MANRWWTKKEQTALDHARESVEEIQELREQSKAAKEALRSAIERRNVEEAARLLPLVQAFDAILADARPVELRLSDVSDAVGRAMEELRAMEYKISSLAPPPGAFKNETARGTAMRGDEDDVDRWLKDDVERDAARAHIRWWRSWRATRQGMSASAELRKIIDGKRSPYEAPMILERAEEELKTMENILSELEILSAKIEEANRRFRPAVGERINTARPGAEKFRM